MLQTIPWDEEPISIAGCYSDIPLDTYHKSNICVGPSVSSSALRLIYLSSPAHYWDESPHNPDRALPDVTKPEADWKTLGRAAHHLLVGAPGHFSTEYIIQKEKVPTRDPEDGYGWSEEHAGKKWHGNITYCKQWATAQRKLKLTIITEEQIKVIQGMADALDHDPFVRGGILRGLIERSLFWKDRETGIWLKSRPDAIPNVSGDAADLKTTKSVLLPDLAYAMEEFGYAQQGALIADGLKAVFDIDMTTFSLVWVEKKRPFCVRTTHIHQDDLARGRLQNRVAIRKFATYMEAYEKSKEAGRPNPYVWPGPATDNQGDEVVTLSLSQAARDRADRRLQYEGMIAK